MTKTDKILIAIIILIGAFALTTAATAAECVPPTCFQKGVQDFKELNCTNPVARADGTPLDISEIEEIRCGVDLVDKNDVPQYTFTMPGGCQIKQIDFAAMDPGTYFQYCETWDKGGLDSIWSVSVPFDLLASPPNAPVVQ